MEDIRKARPLEVPLWLPASVGAVCVYLPAQRCCTAASWT